MSGTTKTQEEKEADELITKTRQNWHQLRGYLTGQGEGVIR